MADDTNVPESAEPVNLLQQINPISSMHNLDPITRYTPWAAFWWTTAYVSGVPESTLGWLLAQGWEVVGTQQDTSTTPPTTYYNCGRKQLNNWLILQTLMAEYTSAYNEGRSKNATRYNDIVTIWNEAILKSQADLDEAGTAKIDHISLYLGELDDVVSEVESDVATSLAELTAAKGKAATQLEAYLARLGEFETNQASLATTSRGLLTDLGTTELARINEVFDARLAAAKQELVSRGFYSSVLLTSMNTSIERERSEAIAELNDRLARERNQNEHVLYGTLQEALRQAIEGGRIYGEDTLRNAELVARSRQALTAQKMEARMAKLTGRDNAHQGQLELLKYQLDARNNLLVGLFGFMERRTDSYPDIDFLANLAMGLGDSGSTQWVTP